jgi:F-type H+-transporting ATPase subunit c
MKTLHLLALVLVVLLLASAPVLAQESGAAHYTFAGAGVGAGLGAAITLIGAGYGFGKIGAAAVESMARQPEVAPRIQTAMLIIGAMLEGATFFALLICIILQGSAKF